MKKLRAEENGAEDNGAQRTDALEVNVAKLIARHLSPLSLWKWNLRTTLPAPFTQQTDKNLNFVILRCVVCL